MDTPNIYRIYLTTELNKRSVNVTDLILIKRMKINPKYVRWRMIRGESTLLLTPFYTVQVMETFHNSELPLQAQSVHIHVRPFKLVQF